ncbi:unnamed protein product [Gongylonema pulchrum]|uniref:VWFA domain-containing protein n=1 Tax=Gongylonema pulchrum TaxID=637853 RepID=A0A183DWN2_9BILA|nr:unnamed protein product [Gongylonema pulchrum]
MLLSNQVDGDSEKFVGVLGQVDCSLGEVLSRGGAIEVPLSSANKGETVYVEVDGDSEKFVGVLGQVDCSLGEVLSRGGAIEVPLSSANKAGFRSILRLEAHEAKLSSQAVRLQFRGHSLPVPASGCPLNAYFMMFLIPEGAARLLLDELLGKCTTSFDQLLRGVGALNAYKLSSFEGKKKGNASIELVNVLQVASSSFVNYVKTGTQIHFAVAVDFTASNGNPLEPSSLHYIHPHRFNPYMTALNAVSSVIQKYNRHGRIAALGFGAQTPPDYRVSHLFFLNGDQRDPHVSGIDGLLDAYRSALLTVRPYAPTDYSENGDQRDPHVSGIDGVLDAYRSALLTVRPYAPTDYSEVIYHTYKFGAAVQRQGSCDHYFVLLIVTDGCVTNAARTVNAIVDCSELPISLVIVGVGDRDFSPMQSLLSPMLKSSEGRLLRREIVTFVPYTASMTDNELVAKLLINVPRQFLSWAMMHGRFAPSK